MVAHDSVRVPEYEHIRESRLAIFREAAMERKALGFAEGPKQPVPPGDVAVIELVNIEFMVD